ncbi:glycosyltransferase family 9 protein [Acidicapsa acidisoli]|uniref:glycosyltransferase family 9 protein n=1 Tax=Acidicapsa acidisoli TaxID=1615681 RepID=UPI0021E06292|nr:glycosyltransferase family 9 protein [Acidicapsa acidisoli]
MRSHFQFRLLVVRLGAMGDILHALPAVTALRRAHPGWKIDWAVQPRWRPLLTAEPENAELDAPRNEARPVVDQVHLVPTKAWGRRPFQRQTLSEIRALRSQMQAAEYEAVLDLQGAIRSAVVARLSGCRRIIGEARPRETPAKWLFTERIETAGEHVIEQDVELASAVAGDLLTPVTSMLPVDDAAEEWCDRLDALNHAIEMGRPVLLIHPGAGWGAKRWPPERYGVVAAEFAMRGGLVLVNAGPGEEALAAAVIAGAQTAERVSVVACSLEQLVALTRRVSIVIGGDTGPVHLACALGKPVVGIYGPTDPRRNGPFGNRFRVLRNPESRNDHTRREQPEAGLLTILPNAVMAAAIDLMLEERRARQSAEEQLTSGSGDAPGYNSGTHPASEALSS